MKKIACLFLISFSLFGFSQNKDFVIKWSESKTFFTSNSKIELPAFEEQFYNFSFEEGLSYIYQWKVQQSINENSVEIINPEFQNISESELKQLNRKLIPNKLKYTINNSVDRGKRFATISISPIINDNGTFKKLLSFSIKYNSTSIVNNKSTSAITNSVLNQGDWYKFHIDTTGVYMLSKSFLSSLGVNVNNIDPRKIKLYGQGGRMLPMENGSDYPFDLTENAIKFVGEEDGAFNSNDHILFYGIGPKGYQEDSNTNINPYSDKSYYFINVSSGFGKRIQPLVEPTADATQVLDSYHHYTFHEVDEYNIALVGRRWFGDRLYIESDKTFDFNIPNLITSQPVRFNVYTAAVSESDTSMQLYINGNNVDNFSFSAINDPLIADGDFFVGDLNINSSNISVTLNYNNNGNPSSVGYLDFISIEGLAQLSYVNGQFGFKNNNVPFLSGIGQYNISNASSVSEVWDVTDRFNVSAIENSANAATFSFKSELGEQREYIAVDPSDYYAPRKDSQTRVSNQNIKGTIFNNNLGQFQDVDYIIVTREDMYSQAQRLAEINRNQYNLNVKVLLLKDIYTEFSSGNTDIAAIRNLVKYVYDNASSPENRIKYLCLFGDASIDYKDRINNNSNIVPSWHSYNSFSLTNAYVSDDYFGMMDDGEGGMQASDLLDIAVGRIIADTPQSAKELVDKIEAYYAEEAYGSWRNNIMVVSDDVDEDWEQILQATTNQIADDISLNKPFLNAIKVHSDSYVQESSAGGERYPAVNDAIFDAIEVGTLVVNYFGHGGEDGIASERIFDKINAQEIQNGCKLNCFVTVTCEYTKFDNPLRVSAGEFLYRNKDGGAIGLITTTREIFVNVGVTFNVKLEEYLFAFGSNEYPSMAEALRLTKNDPSVAGIGQKRLVFFIGDPAMKLAIPKPNIVLTEINDVPVGSITEPLSALGFAKIEGEVTDEFGNLLDTYNGVLTATVFDKDVERSTLGNDGAQDSGGLIIMDFTTLGETIFRGQASVTNGKFEFDFIVPRDIGVPVGNGKISFYAKRDNVLDDQAGSSTDILIGGINENAPEDNQGPTINLYMNDQNFVSGGITNESPTLIAKLFDENGINTSSGIGHDIVAIIDGDETNPYILNDYYVAQVDDHQNGDLSYLLRDLESGLHTLTLKAWDVYNNSSTAEIQFVVHNQFEELVVKNVLNYPNPFIDYTEFWFNHNSSDVLDVSVQVFTVSGKLVKTLNAQTNINDKCCGDSALSRDIVWDGRDDFGDKIGKGVYVYKLTVKSNQLNKTVEKYQKLVIL